MYQTFAKRCGISALGGLVLLLALLCAAIPASADIGYGTIYAEAADGVCQKSASGSSSTVSLVLSATDCGATMTASADGGISPSVHMFISGASNGADSDRPQGRGYIFNTYYFEVFDPYVAGGTGSGGVNVPISLYVDGGANITTTGSTLYSVTGSVGGAASLGFNYSNAGGSSDLSARTVSSSVMLNNWIMVNLELSANAGANVWTRNSQGKSSSAPGSVTVSAFIDSSVTIDPTWLAAYSGAELKFETLQAPVSSAVPEPSFWTLFAVFAVGLALFRRASTAFSKP